MNMKNAKTQSVFLVFVFVFLADICLANPIVIGAPSNAKYSVATNLGLIINAAVDFVALFIGFSITKQVKTVASWKFLPYFLIVFWAELL